MGGIATATIHLAIGLAKHFSKDEHQIMVYEDKIKPSFEEEYLLPNNLKIVKVPKVGPKIYPISFNMQKKIDEFKPDVLYLKGLWRHTSLEAYFWKKRFPNKILILSPAGMLQPVPLKNKKILKKISLFFVEKRLFKLCDAVHSVSELERDELAKSKFKFKKNIYIPEGIPNDFYKKEIIKNQNINSRKVLVTISRIDPIKGLEILLESCKGLDFKNWHYHIYGNGNKNYILKIKNLINLYKLENNVTLNDAIFGNNKKNILNNASAFILPSHSESFSIAIAEAMYYGLPVLTTTKTPWSIIKKNKLGWYIKPSKKELKKALSELFSSSQKELEEIGARAKLYISNKYDLMTTSKQMQKEIISISRLINNNSDKKQKESFKR